MITANNKTQKNKSIESILLILLFAFGALGFMYVFGNSKKDTPENIVVTDEKPVSTIGDAANVN